MESHHAHHAPTGARASFLAGLDRAAAGFVGADGTPEDQGAFVGIRHAPNLPWRMLPLFKAESPAVTGAAEPFEVLTPGRYGRTFALASDRWLIGPLVFKLCSPFWKTEDPAAADRDTARLHFAPSIGGFVEYDNTHSDEPVEVLVGLGGRGCAFRKLDGGAAGFASEGRVGFATVPAAEVRMRLGDSPFVETEAPSETGPFAALLFTVPAKVKRVFPLVLGFFNPDDPGLFYHTVFSDIADVLTNALASNAAVIRRAEELDAGWFSSRLTREQKLNLAQAVRNHLAATALRKTACGWTLERAPVGATPPRAALESFDAEFFPWAVPNRTAAAQSWMDAWPGIGD